MYNGASQTSVNPLLPEEAQQFERSDLAPY